MPLELPPLASVPGSLLKNGGGERAWYHSQENLSTCVPWFMWYTKDTPTLVVSIVWLICHTLFKLLLFVSMHPSFIEVRDTSHKQIWTARSCKWQQTMSELVRYSEQQVQTGGPLAHLSTAFRQPLRDILSLNVHFWVYNSSVSTATKVNVYKIVMSSSGFVLQSDWYHQIQVLEVDSFSCECYQALSSPIFE